MSEIRLRFETVAMGEPDLPAVVANIYDVTPREEGRARRQAGSRPLRSLVVPAAQRNAPEPKFLSVPLEPGRYVVQATLPSGEMITEDVTIAEPGETQDLVIQGEGPHEWTAWQYMAGNVESRQMYHSRPLAKGLAEPLADLVSVWTDRSEVGLNTPRALLSSGFFFDLPGAAEFGPNGSLGDLIPPADRELVEAARLKPRFADGNLWLYTLGIDDLTPDVRFRTGRMGPGEFRHYFLVRGEGLAPQMCVVPLPWALVDGGGALIDLLVQNGGTEAGGLSGSDPGHRLSLAIHDPRVGSVIGYLGSGQLEAAAALLGQAEADIERLAWELLHDKMENRVAAAAGTYALLAAQAPAKREAWEQWVANLMHWFPWLPDGAIQYAWVLLSRDRSAQGLKEARDTLLEGYRRGLPYFSRGVSLLQEGLALVARQAQETGTPDEEVEAARRVVWKLALRTNPRQPFTSVLLR